jgi:putative FmdB family regulatory protein
MPTYEYRCAKCGEDLEVYQTFSEEPLKKHVGCGGKLTKVLSSVGIVLKGSGFYKTDNRDSGSKRKAREDGSGGDSSGSNGSGSDKSEKAEKSGGSEKSNSEKSDSKSSDSGSSSGDSSKSTSASDKKSSDKKSGEKKSPVKSTSRGRE